jgi:hypothetical protein
MPCSISEDAERSRAMTTRRYLVRGSWIALAMPLVIFAFGAISLMFSYDGKCGGFLPWLAAARQCTLADYVVGNLSLFALIVWIEYWPIVIALLALPIGIGYLLDRRHTNRAA